MALETGTKAPDFTLNDTRGEPVTLSEYFGEENILLLFFPLAFTSTCTKELCSTRDNMKTYESLDTTVFGISVDSHFVLKEYKKAHNLNFTLLSDFNRKASEKYDTLYKDFYGMEGVSKRSAYLIGRGGVIRYSEVLEDAGDIPDFDGIVSVIKASSQS